MLMPSQLQMASFIISEDLTGFSEIWLTTTLAATAMMAMMYCLFGLALWRTLNPSFKGLLVPLIGAVLGAFYGFMFAAVAGVLIAGVFVYARITLASTVAYGLAAGETLLYSYVAAGPLSFSALAPLSNRAAVLERLEADQRAREEAARASMLAEQDDDDAEDETGRRFASPLRSGVARLRLRRSPNEGRPRPDSNRLHTPMPHSHHAHLHPANLHPMAARSPLNYDEEPIGV